MNIRIIISGFLGLLLFILFIIIILHKDTKEDEEVYVRDNLFIIPVKDTRYIPTITSIKMDIKDGYLSQGKQIDIEDIIIKNVDIKENKNVEYTFYVRGEYEYSYISGFENYQDYLENDDNLIEGAGEDTIGGPTTGDHWCDELRMGQYLLDNSPGLLDQDRLSSVNHCKTEVRKVHKAHCIVPEVDGYKKIKSELLSMVPSPDNKFETFDYDTRLEQYKILNPDEELCDQKDYDIDYHYQGEPTIEKCRVGGDEITYSGCYRSGSKLAPLQHTLRLQDGLNIPEEIILPHPYLDFNKELEEEKECDPESTEGECIKRLDCTVGYYHQLDNHPRLISSTGSAEIGIYEFQNGGLSDRLNTCEKGSLLPPVVRDDPEKYNVLEDGIEIPDKENYRVNHFLSNTEINNKISISCAEGNSNVLSDRLQLENCSRDGTCSFVSGAYCVSDCYKSTTPSALQDLPLYTPTDDVIPYSEIEYDSYDVTCSDLAKNTGENGEIYCDLSKEVPEYTLAGCYPSYCDDIKDRDEMDDDSDTEYVCLQKSFKIDINELEKDNFTICTNNETTNSPSEVIYQCNNSQTFTDSYNKLKDSILESSGYKDVTKSDGSPLFNVNISKMQHLINNKYNVEYIIFCEGNECPDLGDEGVETSGVARMITPQTTSIQLPNEESMFDDVEETMTPEEEQMRAQFAQLSADFGTAPPAPRQRTRQPASR